MDPASAAGASATTATDRRAAAPADGRRPNAATAGGSRAGIGADLAAAAHAAADPAIECRGAGGDDMGERAAALKINNRSIFSVLSGHAAR